MLSPLTTPQPHPEPRAAPRANDLGQGRIIAGGRLLDSVANGDLHGTLEEIARSLHVRAEDLVPALAELSEVGWVTVLTDADGSLLLQLAPDAR